MKRKLFLMSLVFLFSTSLFAQTFSIDGINYTVTDATNNYVEVSTGSCYSGDLILPETVTYNSATYTVTSIGNNAFRIYTYDFSGNYYYYSSCTTLTSISIPDSVTSIGTNAFAYANRLASVSIGNSVTSIGYGAFFSCSSLASVSIPNSVTSIGDYAFRNCISLASVSIPDSVTSIGASAFYNNRSLASVSIGNSVTSIGANAFAYTRLASVSIPNSVTSIGDYAFNNCTALTTILCDVATPLPINQGVFQGVNKADCLLTVPDGSVASYRNANVWKDFYTPCSESDNLTITKTPVVFNIGDMAQAITTWVDATGSLTWYTTQTGGTGTTTAPVIDTSTEGRVSYWVTQTINGCESYRKNIEIIVKNPTSSSTAKSLHFDGVDDYVQVSNFDYSVSNNFTLDFWVKPEKTITIPGQATSGIYGTGGQSYALFPFLIADYVAGFDNNHAGAGVSVGTNGICVFEHAGGYMPALLVHEATITDWTRVTVVYTNKQPSLYINGTLVKTGLTSIKTYVHPPTSDFGSSSLAPHANYGPFQGFIDRLFILNESVVPSATCEPTPNASNVLAYYNFNQGNAGNSNSTVNYLLDASHTYIGILNNFNLTGSTSNWLADATSTMLPTTPTVTTPVVYNQGATAMPLTATTTETGLLWYSTQTGGTGTTEAPTLDTSVAGTTSYWVSSTNANGCEGERAQIDVQVTAYATHLNFDGVDDNVALPTTATNIPSGNSNYTIEAWINPLLKGVKGIVGWGDYGTTNKTNAFRLTPTGLVNYWWNNDLTVNYTFELGTWYHVVASYNGTTRQIYVNGVLIGQDTPASGVHNVTNTTNLTIGETGLNSEFFKGSIDEVRIWNVARTAEQIAEAMNCELQGNETGLVAYYQFNQGFDAADNTGETTLTDVTANANNGTLTDFALTGATSNWLAGSPVETGITMPSMPTVSTPVEYNKDDTATALTATTGGTGLMWYTTAIGGTGSTEAPTPDTSTVGDTSYWVSSTNANGCESERSEIVVMVSETTLGVDNFNKVGLKIYPNPSKGLFKINTQYQLRIEVFDMLGKRITGKTIGQGENTLDMSHYASGVYLLKASNTAGRVKTYKLIKQ